MKIPKIATVTIRHKILITDFTNSFELEKFERDFYSNKEIENQLEEWLRDCLWEHIPENKISIEFD